MKVRHTATRTVEQEYSYIYSPTVWWFPKAPWTDRAYMKAEWSRLVNMFDGMDMSTMLATWRPEPYRLDEYWWRPMSHNMGSSWRLTNG